MATPTLSPPAFQQLMRQVIDELCQSGFVLQADLDAIGVSGFQSDSRSQILDQVLVLNRLVVRLEKGLTNLDGTIVKLEGRIKSLEDQRAGKAIERGGKTFRDLGAVAVWVQMFKDKDLYCYCVDMVTLIMRLRKHMRPLLRVWQRPLRPTKQSITV
jgi:hypothetical protein